MMIQKKKRLIDVVPGWAVKGIFGALAGLTSYNVPWVDVNAIDLDMEYFGNKSGDKLTSPLVDKLLVNDVITDENLNRLASILASIYGENWLKLWQTLKFEYNPIENYDMTETGTETGTVGTVRSGSKNETDTRNKSRTSNDTGESTQTETPAEVITTTGEGTSKKDTNVYGFNSDVPGVPSDSETDTDTTKTTETHSGTNTTKLNTKQDGTETENESIVVDGSESGNETRTDDLKHTLNRHGNIGVTTSQQMIESERQLWLWVFFDVVFADVDKILTSPIY